MITGVILAGGSNDTIDGTFKSFLAIKKKRVIDLQLREMKKICEEIMVVTNSPHLFLSSVKEEIRIITDFHKGKGQLGGLYSACSLSTQPYLWVVGCGMPFISSKAALLMYKKLKASETIAAVPQCTEGLSLLHGIYNKHIFETVEHNWNTDDHCMQFIQHISYQSITKEMFEQHGIDSTFLFSINNENDYEHVKTKIENGSFNFSKKGINNLELELG